MKSPFPQDWQEHTIGDCLCRVEHPVKVYPDTLYTQIGIRSHGKGLFYKEPVTGESLGNKAVYWIEPDCLVLNIVFAWEQAIGKTTQAEVGMIGSHRFPMYKPVNNLVDIDYLIYYLLTKRGTDILEAASPGGAGRNRTLGQDRFMKSRIVLPPLDEQKKIAEILATQDKAIELQGRKIEKLKRFKQGCLERMFPREGQKVPEKRFPGFTDDWEQRKLGECFTERIESMPDGELISVTINDGIKKFSELGRHDNSNEDKSKYKKVCVGDIAYNSMRMWQGASGYSPYEGIVSPAYTVLSPNPGINSKCLAYQFKLPEIIHTFQVNSQGITSDNWNLKYPALSQIEIFVSKDEQEQAKIAEYFENLDNLITLHQRKLEEMKKQKKALMQLLLTGIVKVL